jgi:hypothetical protein
MVIPVIRRLTKNDEILTWLNAEKDFKDIPIALSTKIKETTNRMAKFVTVLQQIKEQVDACHIKTGKFLSKTIHP